jgi:hypothetical protein
VAQPREEQVRLLGWWRLRHPAPKQPAARGSAPVQSSDARRVATNALRQFGRQVRATDVGLRFWGGGE